MKLTILGCGTAIPNKYFRESGYLLEIDDIFYLFDSGTGIKHRLIEKGITLDKISHIFYTHFHNDHINDLPSILWTRGNPFFPKTDLNIYGPSGLDEHFKKILKFIGKDMPLKFPIKIREITNQTLGLNNIKITTQELPHFGNIAYRIEHDGKVIVYTGDASPCDELNTICKDADLVLMECGVTDDSEEPGHMTPSTCAATAKNANIKKLILIHRYPELDNIDLISELKKQFGGDIILGEDFMEFKL